MGRLPCRATSRALELFVLIDPAAVRGTWCQGRSPHPCNSFRRSRFDRSSRNLQCRHCCCCCRRRYYYYCCHHCCCQKWGTHNLELRSVLRISRSTKSSHAAAVDRTGFDIGCPPCRSCRSSRHSRFRCCSRRHRSRTSNSPRHRSRRYCPRYPCCRYDRWTLRCFQRRYRRRFHSSRPNHFRCSRRRLRYLFRHPSSLRFRRSIRNRMARSSCRRSRRLAPRGTRPVPNTPAFPPGCIRGSASRSSPRYTRST
jgi:hypothetical protein